MESQRVEDRLHPHMPASLDIFKNQLNNKKLNIHTNLWSICSAIFCSCLIKSKQVRKKRFKIWFCLLRIPLEGKNSSSCLVVWMLAFEGQGRGHDLNLWLHSTHHWAGTMVMVNKHIPSEWIFCPKALLCFYLLWWHLYRPHLLPSPSLLFFSSFLQQALQCIL